MKLKGCRPYLPSLCTRQLWPLTSPKGKTGWTRTSDGNLDADKKKIGRCDKLRSDQWHFSSSLYSCTSGKGTYFAKHNKRLQLHVNEFICPRPNWLQAYPSFTEGLILAELKYLVFTRMPGDSYRRQYRVKPLPLCPSLTYMCDHLLGESTKTQVDQSYQTQLII